jgi:hypothetical protein
LPPAGPNGLHPIVWRCSDEKGLGLTLRALDGHLAGESYRAIAHVLFGSRRVPSGAAWKTHDLRDRTIRLVRTGVRLVRGGYLDLLRHPAQKRE